MMELVVIGVVLVVFVLSVGMIRRRAQLNRDWWRRHSMTIIVYGVGGVVAAALFAYLMLALLKPEWFA